VKTTWYCDDCETRIDGEEVDDHESRGHHVRGVLVPDRLMPNDPWQTDAYPESRSDE